MSQILPLLLALVALAGGCAPMKLATYAAHPDYPRFREGQELRLDGLTQAVSVVRRQDGLWKISAQNEADAMRVQGYLVASDRMFQLDLFRHMARGELAALLGERPFGGKTTLDADVFNRFLGFHRDALRMLQNTSPEELAALQAYIDGINAWIDHGQLSLEHRLLGISSVRQWEPADSISIYLMLMYSLSGNADREIRRLVIACEAGIEGMQQVFPTNIEFGSYALPEEAFRMQTYEVPPAIVPEIRRSLPQLCAQGAAEAPRSTAATAATFDKEADEAMQGLALLGSQLRSLSTSNNWVVNGPLTRSGFPLVANDPHLPHMNPPIVWGVEIETPTNHVAGFTIPGLHRVVFGHNFHVAWGATTNHVDRQDLVVHRGRSRDRSRQTIDGYELDGKFVPFEYRREHFEVRGGSARDVTVRFTEDGPLLNDIEPLVAGRIPLTALRMTSLGEGRDLDGARRINYSRNIRDFIEGIDQFDQGCSNWVFGDTTGGFGYRSPCLLPIRRGWQGAFPIPGWLRAYRWQGYVPKKSLPASTNPDRGWLVTANSQIIPARRFFTTYNNDAQAPNRTLRIAERIGEDAKRGITVDTSAAIQIDEMHQRWTVIRAGLAGGFCAGSAPGQRAEDAELQRALCAWDGSFGPTSTAATIYTLWSNAILDHALADALPGGPSNPTWSWIQSLPQFEAVAQWLWTRAPDDPIWDDVTTPAKERRETILLAAFRDAVDFGRRHYGADWRRWQWGKVRPFVLRHPFAANDGVAGGLFNSKPLEIGGDIETVFKQQFPRSDREQMKPIIGPVVRFNVDMAEPWSATYTLAGGESGWAGSPYYGNLLTDWAVGNARPLTPQASATDLHLRFAP